MDKKRYENPWFWIGLIGVVLTAMGINPEMLTDWGLVRDALVGLVCNPFMLGSTAVAVLGVFVNPNTHGIKD